MKATSAAFSSDDDERLLHGARLDAGQAVLVGLLLMTALESVSAGD